MNENEKWEFTSGVVMAHGAQIVKLLDKITSLEKRINILEKQLDEVSV